MPNFAELPTYLNQEFYDNYNAELNQTLQEYTATLNTLLGENYWSLPSITSAQVVTLEPIMPVGAFWFNGTTAKMQLKTAAGVVETVTSAP